MPILKVLIADDHTVVRQGLKGILCDELREVEIGEAKNAQEVLRQVRQRDWNILVLDINMPDRSGFEVMKDIRKLRPRLPILVLSIYPEEQFAARMLKAGAAGYMTKEAATEELIGAVRKVLGGSRYVSAALAEKLAFGLLAHDRPGSQENLSDREFQVLRLIGSGKKTRDIALRLQLSTKTIGTYRERILAKLGMASTAELIRYAVDRKLID